MRTVILSLIIITLFLGFSPAISLAGGTWNGWIYQDPYPTSVNLFDVKFVTQLKGWITGKYGMILYTEDGGDNWEVQESGTEEDLVRVSFVNEKMGWAAGRNGTIIHTANAGKTWITQYNIKALPTEIFFLNEREGWITGSNPIGVLFQTRDSGKTWQRVETDINRAIASIYFFNSQIGWILAGEEVYWTPDGGKKWEKSKLPIGKLSGHRVGGGAIEGLGMDWHYGDIVFTSEKQGWAVVNQWVFHTEDGGKTWIMQLNAGDMSYGLGHISFNGEKNGCVSGWTIYCTEDGGKIWQERLGLEPGDSKMLGGVALTGQSEGWTVGNDGRIMKTQDGGKNWKNVNKFNECGDIPFFINKKTGWLYQHFTPHSLNVACRTDDGGQTWTKQDIGMKVMNIFFINDLTGWAVGIVEEQKDPKSIDLSNNRIKEASIIKYTTDGGKTWITQFKEYMSGKSYTDLVGVFFINPNTGWVVGDSGYILHTEDAGKHWERQESGSIKNSLTRVYFINSEEGWATGYQFANQWTGIILHTKDGGKHWKVQHSLRDAGLVDLNFTGSKAVWVSGHSESGEISVLLNTENGGLTWSEKRFERIGYNHMAFYQQKNGVIYSSETGLMVVTTDGGKTWKKRRLPLKKYPWHFSQLFQN